METEGINVQYTSAITEEQARRFLSQMKETMEEESEYYYFADQFEAMLEVAQENAAYDGSPFTSPDGYAFLILNDDIMGYVFIGVNDQELAKDECPDQWAHAYIWELYLLPTVREKGWSKALIQHALRLHMGEIRIFQASQEAQPRPLILGAEAIDLEADGYFEAIGFRLLAIDQNESTWIIECETLLNA